MPGITWKINKTIEDLKKTDINGCITGSSMTGADFDSWSSQPDIDVFVYSQPSLVHAVCVLMYKLDFVPGKLDPSTEKGEAWKIDRVFTKSMKKDMPLSTVSLKKDGVVVNVTCKRDKRKMIDVISDFDMTIVMVAYDIRSKHMLDLRGEDKKKALPNPLKHEDSSLYTVAKWIRQFDRVIKYYDRGFDTLPMAKFYIEMIDEALATGALFQTEKSKEVYEEFSKEFVDMRKKIQAWVEDKEEN